jgi:pimeloyl-ACP methyl ester carboxylesterase
MKRNTILLVFAVILALSACLISPSLAQNQQTKTTFVRLAGGVPGVLYEPVSPAEKSQIGIFAMHSGGDYLSFSACAELAKRGYRVLCANNSSSKSESFTTDASIDKIILEARLGVTYLRKYPGIRKVVLLGHSGGGAVMASYQDVAENGLKACQGPEKIIKCSDSLAGVPPADGLMLVDSNWGLGTMMLFSLDPAVVSEDNGQELNPELDLFDPKNGFDQKGSTYSDAFVRKFLSAEGKRNSRLIKNALDRLEKINAGKGLYKDDEPLIVPGADYKGHNNRLFAQDIRLMSHTRKAWPLLRPDGSIVTQVVHSVRVPQNFSSRTPLLEGGTLTTTVKKFLNTFAIRVTDDYGYNEDSVRGIDWDSSYSNPPGNVRGVTVPLLTMGMTGHWEYLAAETIHERAKSADKTLVFVEGANHTYTTCTQCEKYAGQFGDTMKTIYDYIDSWLSKKGRF